MLPSGAWNQLITAMKIRCTECRKKISIDDAFAGGVCRCPYCTATVAVGAKAPESSRQARPAAPTSRPAAPESPAGRAPPAGQEPHIPLAAPVMVQGIFAMVLLGILALAIIGGAAAMIVNVLGGNGGNGGNGDEPLNPFAANPSRPAVAGNIMVTTPVIYVVGDSSSMAQVIEYASAVTKASIGSLKSGKFSILLCGEESDEFMSGGYTQAGESAVDAAGKFLEKAACRGLANIPRAMAAAQARDPKTIVLLWRGGADGMEDLAAQAKQRGLLIITIALDASKADRRSQADFAKAAGGRSLSYTRGDLAYWYNEAGAGE